MAKDRAGPPEPSYEEYENDLLMEEQGLLALMELCSTLGEELTSLLESHGDYIDKNTTETFKMFANVFISIGAHNVLFKDGVRLLALQSQLDEARKNILAFQAGMPTRVGRDPSGDPSSPSG